MRQRKIPQASADLAERIISAAQPRVKQQAVFVWFRPALAFAAMLALIVGVSFYMSVPTVGVSNDGFDDISTYMVYETLIEFEEFS